LPATNRGLSGLAGKLSNSSEIISGNYPQGQLLTEGSGTWQNLLLADKWLQMMTLLNVSRTFQELMYLEHPKSQQSVYKGSLLSYSDSSSSNSPCSTFAF
jgi:hypothetical protein